MKRSLATLFTILSLSILLNIERGQVDLCGESVVKHIAVNVAELSFTPRNHCIDLNDYKGYSAKILAFQLITDRTPSKRNKLDLLSGVRVA